MSAYVSPAYQELKMKYPWDRSFFLDLEFWEWTLKTLTLSLQENTKDFSTPSYLALTNYFTLPRFSEVQTAWIYVDIYIKQQRGKFSVLLSSHYIKQNLVSTVDEYESLDLITTLQIPWNRLHDFRPKWYRTNSLKIYLSLFFSSKFNLQIIFYIFTVIYDINTMDRNHWWIIV